MSDENNGMVAAAEAPAPETQTRDMQSGEVLIRAEHLSRSTTAAGW